MDKSNKPRHIVAVSNFDNNLGKIAFGLLLPNRQIIRDTMPTLYALTLFTTKDCRILGIFLGQIGAKIELIHRVQIHCSRPESLCFMKTMKHLESATSLETLELGPSFRKYIPERLATMVAPLIRASHDHDEFTDTRRAPIEVVFLHEANAKTLLSGTKFHALRDKENEYEAESPYKSDYETKKDFRSIKNYIKALEKGLRKSP